jgi:hypothetical protein
MGFNPAWTSTTARDRNAALVTQFDSAVTQTTRRITQCQSAPSPPRADEEGCVLLHGFAG